jgi:hypothetical protein
VADPAGGPCRFDDSGRLVVTVRNQGRAPAGASVADVRLERRGRSAQQSGPVNLRTSALPAGGATELAVDPGDYQVLAYSVRVDREGRVKESNEANNTASVRCPVVD